MAVLIILAIFSIFFGYITKDIYIGLGSAFFADNSVFIHPSHEILIQTEWGVPTLFKLLPFICTILFSVLAIVLSEFFPEFIMSFKFTRFGYNLFGFFNQRFLVELFYNRYVTGFVLKFGGHTTKILDKGSIELVGPFGLEKGLLNLSNKISSLDTGVVTTYALYILTGLILYMLILFFSIEDNSLVILIIFAFFSVLSQKKEVGLTFNLIPSPSKDKSPVRLSGGSHSKSNPNLKGAGGRYGLSIRSTVTTREYSSSTNSVSKPLSDEHFIEWLRGLVDGEGTFKIVPSGAIGFTFRFEIALHVDDTPMLNFIQNKLNFGKVYTYGNFSVFSVWKVSEVAKIIALFDSAPLNTSKQWNYLDFKKAFELYSHRTKQGRSELKTAIDQIRSGMNSKRTCFSNPVGDIRVTGSWLLGFVEGEGSFFVRKTAPNYSVGFSIGQTESEFKVLEAIRDFLLELPGKYKTTRETSSTARKNSNFVGIYTDKARKNAKPMVSLMVQNPDSHINVLIPFEDSLPWYSKKRLDYIDWKTILKIKGEGKHFTPEGQIIVKSLAGRMNNNRLSTNLVKPDNLSDENIQRLLASESNFEIHPNGKIWIKSLGKYYREGGSVAVEVLDESGLVVNSFSSLTDCASFFGVGKNTISRRISNYSSFIFNGKHLKIKRVLD
jgi:hypothetical protein